MSVLWLIPLVAVLSALGCGAYLGLARHRQWLDHPNERSAHALPTPHGGGVPLLLAWAAGVGLAALLGVDWAPAYLWLLGLALGLMLLGLLDDTLDLPVVLRFAAYALCCALGTALLLPSGAPLWLLALIALALLWGLNLYNFMDGIDGFAATQCLMACGAGALLALVYGGGTEYALFCILLAASQLGFLAWNLPPAKLFMGDAGSVPTGFLLGGLALWGEVTGDLPAASWLILLAVFITDASWTLVARLIRGENVTQAHREHLYQRLARRSGSHLWVLVGLLVVLAFWLFPLAWAAQTFQALQIFLVTLAYLPLLVGMAMTRHIT